MQSAMQLYLFVSGAIFGIVALAHLVRALRNWDVVVGPASIPISVSWVGFVGASILCLWAIRLAAS